MREKQWQRGCNALRLHDLTLPFSIVLLLLLLEMGLGKTIQTIGLIAYLMEVCDGASCCLWLSPAFFACSDCLRLCPLFR